MDDLFPSGSGYLPTPRPDETLYSWVARCHNLGLAWSSSVTSRLLFGHPHAGLRADIPFHLTQLEQRTNKRLGLSLHVLSNRTLYGFHSHFLDVQLREQIATLLMGDGNSAARGLLGLKKHEMCSASRPKVCECCLASQIATAGHSWWQLQHQYPSSFVCGEHGLPLRRLMLPTRRGRAAGYFLPEDLAPDLSESVPTPFQLSRLESLTKWGYLLGEGALEMSDAMLRWVYRIQASNMGLTTLDGSLRMKAIRDAYVDFYSCIEPWLDGSFRVPSAGGLGFLLMLFGQYPGHRHAFLHILLIGFLFKSYSEFEALVTQVQKVLTCEGELGCEALIHTRQRAVASLAGELGLPICQVAQQMGVSFRSVARVLDKQQGVARQRKKRIVKSEAESRLRKCLASGLNYCATAECAGVRPSYVRAYLSERPTLKEAWSKAHLATEVERHRAELVSALNSNPGMPVRRLRRLPHNGFQWLYNHDREWLRSVLPALWKR